MEPSMRLRLSFLKDGELVAEAFADIPGTSDITTGGRFVLQDVRRLRPGEFDLLDETVTGYLEVMSDENADRT
jgi:hypothetical protein